MSTWRSLLLTPLVLGCGAGEAATSRGRVVLDSLPDGTPRTITELPVGWSDTSGWKLVEVARITGGTEGEGDLVNPQSVAIDAAGNIYVADRSPASLKKYGPDGTFLRSIAREGQGPGEFQVGFLALHGAHLYLQDPRQTRTSVFDTSGTFLRSWPTYCCYWTNLLVDSAGHVGVSGPPPREGQEGDQNPWARTVRWYRPDSTSVDTLLLPAEQEPRYWEVKQGSNMMGTDIPWLPGRVFAFLPDHRIILGSNATYLIAVTRNNGTDTTALFGRSWVPTPIPDAVREAEVERRIQEEKQNWDETLLRNAFRLSDVPTTAPAYEWIDSDGEGNLWVRLPLPGDSTRTLFDVFDPELRWRGQVSGTDLLGQYRTRIIGDLIVGMGEDREGNPVVAVYRIERGGGTQ
jgi:hypothetical protein